MASSSIEVCNIMLSWLSTKQIVSFDDDTKESNFCKFNYEMSRRFVLEAREWSFAIKRVTLTPTAEVPPFGYNFTFLKPTDSIRILGVYNPSDRGNPNAPVISHRAEDTNIIADISEIDVRYIFDQKTTNRFSPSFSQALAAYMGTNAAVPLTQDKANRKEMAILYAGLLQDASAADALQGSREMLQISQQEQSRRMHVRPV